MNKSERANLSSVIAEMIYNYNSENSTIAFGERLLVLFPQLAEAVNTEKDFQHLLNVEKVFFSAMYNACCTQSRQSAMDRKLPSIMLDGNLWQIITDYVNERNLDPEELASDLDEHYGNPNFTAMINDPVYKSCVDFYFKSDEDKQTLNYKLYSGQMIRGEDEY